MKRWLSLLRNRAHPQKQYRYLQFQDAQPQRHGVFNTHVRQGSHLPHKRGFNTHMRQALVLFTAFALVVSSFPKPIAAQTIEFPNGATAELHSDGSITGTCRLTDGRVTASGYSATAVLPDGTRLPAGCYERYLGSADHNNYPGPCDGTYSFKATKKDNGYFVVIYSQYAAAGAPGVLIPGPPPGYTYQRTYTELWNPEMLVHISLVKRSSNEAFTTGNAEYSLEGARYDIFNASNQTKVTSITTNAQGYASCKLPVGRNYYAKEITAPKGYVLSSSKLDFVASSSDIIVQTSDDPMWVEVDVRKTDAATGSNAQPGLSLAGARFKLVDARGQTQETITNSEGIAHFSKLPLGKFSICETKAPEGYKLNSQVFEYYVSADAKHEHGRVLFTADTPIPNNPIAFDIELAKFKENPAAEEGGVRWPAEGVQFEIISKTTNTAVATLTTDVYGFAKTPDDAWHGAGTRSAGVAGSIPYDRKGYVVREVASSVPEGYEHMEDFEIGVEQQVDGLCLKYIIENVTPDARLQIVKTDQTSGSTVPLAGFTFELQDSTGKPVTQEAWYPNHVTLQSFTTDNSGCVTLPEQLVPGTYHIKETAVQAPYLLANKQAMFTLGKQGGALAVVRFANVQAHGKATLIKTDSETGKPLANAQYNVVAQTRIISPDGYVQALEGEVVAQVTTNDQGIGGADNLPLGTGEARYAFVEVQAPAGYQLDSSPLPFVLSYKDAYTPVVEAQVEASNNPVIVQIEKTEAKSNKPLVDVKFELRNEALSAKNAVENSQNNKAADAKPLSSESLQVASTNDAGVAQWKYLAPGFYVLKETETLPGYLLNTQEYRFEIDAEGKVLGEGFEGGELKLENDFTKVAISKRDMTNEDEVPGAKLSILDKDGEIIERWTSTEKEHRIERLIPGTYTLHEEQTPATHDVAEEVDFEVLETGEVQHVVMYDEPIKVSGEIDKRQEIAAPIAKHVVANGDGLNVAEPQNNTTGSFDYSLDWRNTSNTWVDEFTVSDQLLCCSEGLAKLEGITTPVAVGDYDGKYNLWYQTNLSTQKVSTAEECNTAKEFSTAEESSISEESSIGEEYVIPKEVPFIENDKENNELDTPYTVSSVEKIDEAEDTSTPNATFSDKHTNPWLIDERTQTVLGKDGRALEYEGWHIWQADLDASKAIELELSELNLAEGEYITGLRFEYGCVDEGFTIRREDWKRTALKDQHDDVTDATRKDGKLAPALLHLRVTENYQAKSSLHNFAQLDLFRNGGGQDLEDHDSDEVIQTAGKGEIPRPSRPHGSMPQTSDTTALIVAGVETVGLTTVAAAWNLIKRRKHKQSIPRR